MYIDSQVKLEPNWDRNAVAPPKPKKPPEKPVRKLKPVPRKKPKLKAEVKDNKEPLFEDVEFVTPPLTPEILAPQLEIVAATNKRDDDFWNFYDQGLPPIK